MKYLHMYRWQLLSTTSLIVLTFLAFGHSLIQGFAPVDDALLIYENATVWGLSWHNIRTIFTSYDPELYIPFTFLSFQINYAFGGLDPFVYHLTNLLFHAVNAVLVMWLVDLLSGRKWMAFLLAALFAVHPLNSEAVVWIAGRKDLLSTTFFLLAFIWYLKEKRCTKTGGIFFLCGLLSKVMVVTLPIVLVLHDVLISRKTIKESVRSTAPYFVLSFLFGLIAMGGKTRIIAATSLMDTALMAAKSSVFYLKQIFAPSGLSLVYPFRGDITLMSPEFIVPVLIIITLLYAVWRLRNSYPMFTFSILFFFVTLAPTFFHVNKGNLMFFAVDRYAYLPMIGIITILAVVLGRVMQDIRRTVLIIMGVVLLTFTLISRQQTLVWDSPDRLFEHSLKHYPESILARTALGRIYRQQGRTQLAFDTLRDGIAYGDHMHLRLGAGTIYAKTGQLRDARLHFKAAMKLAPDNPEPHFYLGSLEEQVGNTSIAQELFEIAVGMDDSYVPARNHLGNIYLEKEMYDEAFEQFAASAAWNPNSLQAYEGLVAVLTAQGKIDDLEQYKERIEVLRN